MSLPIMEITFILSFPNEARCLDHDAFMMH